MADERDDHAIYDAVVEFVRVVRADSRVEELGGDPRRRRKVVAEIVRETAARHGMDPAELARAAALMLTGKEPEASAPGGKP